MEEVWSTVQNTGAKNNTMDTKMSTSPDFPKAVFAFRGTAGWGQFTFTLFGD